MMTTMTDQAEPSILHGTEHPFNAGQFRWTLPEGMSAKELDTDDDVPRCCMCVRALRNPRRRIEWQGFTFCQVCPKLPGNNGVVIGWWVRRPRLEKRAKIILAFGIDPYTFGEVEVDAEYSLLHEDVDGLLAAVEVRRGNHGFGAGAYVLPVVCFWDVYTTRPGAFTSS
jgi:hypothetical protein